jgi:hypothetical protein
MKMKKRGGKSGLHANLFFLRWHFLGDRRRDLKKKHTQQKKCLKKKKRADTLRQALSHLLCTTFPAQGGRGESRQAPGIVGIICIYYNSVCVCVCICRGLENLFQLLLMLFSESIFTLARPAKETSSSNNFEHTPEESTPTK